jgi:FG-GAP repeat protein
VGGDLNGDGRPDLLTTQTDGRTTAAYVIFLPAP